MHRALPLLVALLGVTAAVVGVVAVTTTGPASFGWTAYSPLSDQVYVPSLRVPWWALALAVVGAAAAGAGVTAAVLRRR